MDIHYEAVGFANGMILIKVTGDPETIIEGEFGLKDEFPYNLQPGDEVLGTTPMMAFAVSQVLFLRLSGMATLQQSCLPLVKRLKYWQESFREDY